MRCRIELNEIIIKWKNTVLRRVRERCCENEILILLQHKLIAFYSANLSGNVFSLTIEIDGPCRLSGTPDESCKVCTHYTNVFH